MWRRLIVIVASVIALSVVGAAEGSTPQVLPPTSKPHGKTYAAWSVAWWQWALTTPASVNPVLDPTGDQCAQGQTGHVWFLAGSFGNGKLDRKCTIPPGTALFFPLISAVYGAFLNDPDRTETFVRAQVACNNFASSAQIDGATVSNPLQYYTPSPLFDVQLPQDNVFGLTPDVAPQLLLSPSVATGLYIFLPPLAPGTHTIRWTASESCPFGDFTQDVTYQLSVG